MPPLDARGAGVDVQQSELLVVLHLQDVRVAADEELGRTRHELPHDAAVVAAGVAAYVFHQHVYLLALEPQHLRKHAAQVAAVAVAAHGTQGPEGGQAVGQFGRADVAGVPYLVARLKVVQVAVVPVGVGVAQYAYPFHSPKRSLMNREMSRAVPSMPNRLLFTHRS